MRLKVAIGGMAAVAAVVVGAFALAPRSGTSVETRDGAPTTETPATATAPQPTSTQPETRDTTTPTSEQPSDAEVVTTPAPQATEAQRPERSEAESAATTTEGPSGSTTSITSTTSTTSESPTPTTAGASDTSTSVVVTTTEPPDNATENEGAPTTSTTTTTEPAIPDAPALITASTSGATFQIRAGSNVTLALDPAVSAPTASGAVAVAPLDSLVDTGDQRFAIFAATEGTGAVTAKSGASTLVWSFVVVQP